MNKPAKVKNADGLRLRIIEVKKRFGKRINYTLLYEYEFGKQPKEVIDRIRAVWNLREVDETVTKNLEKIAKNAKAA